jgi:hypothetical protein
MGKGLADALVGVFSEVIVEVEINAREQQGDDEGDKNDDFILYVESHVVSGTYLSSQNR